LISDELTKTCFESEANLFNITPWNYQIGLKYWKPDFLLVESAWNGYLLSWKGKIASYPQQKNRDNHKLKKVIEYAKNLGIKCVFWNKEDGVHFERFISSASLFDYILTVDSNCVPKYKNRIKHDVKVGTLMFAVQPVIHGFKGFEYQHKKVNFVGSYNRLQHGARREWQDIMFTASENFGLDIYDRRSSSHSKDFNYPDFPFATLKKRVPHHKTGDIYRNYIASLNVNSVTDSPTMFSRRLIEIIGCGRLAITNPSPSVNNYFKDYCEVASTSEELLDIYKRLENGYTKKQKEMLKEGSEYVIDLHSYSRRLAEIISFLEH
jgi:hypothetical protein